LANGTVLLTVDSKSKSKPSTAEDPKGRSAEDEDCCGPNVVQIRFAAEIALEEEGKPPSV
jgi:hypothetical protein